MYCNQRIISEKRVNPIMITCIVLAAGESTRFPGNKLLFEIKPNISILEFLLRSILASKVDQTIVILGHEADLLASRIQNLRAETLHTVTNPIYHKGGMSSSIRRGVEHALDSHAILITPADIPFIPSEVFDKLIDYYISHKPLLIIPTYKNRKGHPILISSELFEKVLAISEEKRGLKEIIETYYDDIVFLSTDVAAILQDVDNYEDFIELQSNTNDQI